MASHEDHAPVETNVFKGRLFWLSHSPLRAGQTYRLRLLSREVPVLIQEISALYDVEQLSSAPSDQVPYNGIAEVVLRSQAMLALDSIGDNPATGRFVLTDGTNLVAGGTISMQGYPNQRASVTRRSSNLTEVEHKVTTEVRQQRNGHRGGVLWFTGLSGAGKSTVAMAVERELFRRGLQAYVLDGDNIRYGLSADLGFAPEDRAENIRRVGEVAALFADAGMIVITAFISPYRSDRQRARSAAHDAFHEIYIKADLAACESRDPKGLYQRARKGEIPEFTGISAPYEPPEEPNLVVDTQHLTIDACVAAVIDYVEKNFRT
jgi:bifunctional enzyme CysN/CysC